MSKDTPGRTLGERSCGGMLIRATVTRFAPPCGRGASSRSSLNPRRLACVVDLLRSRAAVLPAPVARLLRSRPTSPRGLPADLLRSSAARRLRAELEDAPGAGPSGGAPARSGSHPFRGMPAPGVKPKVLARIRVEGARRSGPPWRSAMPITGLPAPPVQPRRHEWRHGGCCGLRHADPTSERLGLARRSQGADMRLPTTASLVERQRAYFKAGNTRPASWRKEQLEAIKAMFTENHDEMCDALWKTCAATERRRPDGRRLLRQGGRIRARHICRTWMKQRARADAAGDPSRATSACGAIRSA